METLLTSTLFALQPGEVITLSIHSEQRLRVDEAAGTDLWVTRDTDSADYWLRAGSSLLLSRGEELTLSVEPSAARAVHITLISEARRPAATDLGHIIGRLARRLVRGAEWTPNQTPVSAA
jgi:hypothetical protein